MKTGSTPKQVILLCGLAILAAGLSAVFHPKRPAWFKVSSSEELRWQILPEDAIGLSKEANVLWVDAREREAFEAAHQDGAILLNLDEWGDLMFRHMHVLQGAFDRPVIVYCDAEDCGKSREVAKRLRELIGLDPVYVLKGSWRDLTSETP
ncbi:MAG: rhodanese-like domain-containing protein [Verrucomicrobiales bacterium]|nr:rhodanese-like domain-containing protein [Verrucomicrobiales bacterium]